MQVVLGLRELVAVLQHEPEVFVLMDENTKKHCYPLIKELVPGMKPITIAAGEEYKTIDTCRRVWQALLAARASRNALLLCLGGGVITDLGAFAAATYKRGIRFVLVPTTLLAMVDAAIGGKAAINEGDIKNSVGLFTTPFATVVFSIFLKTLPHRQLLSGMAEMMKHGLIADARHWKDTVKVAKQGDTPGDALIQASIRIKQRITEADPYEQGQRKLLNFGHTTGHALEALALKNKQPLLHGEAVAWGMVHETKLSEKYCGLPSGSADEIEETLSTLFAASKPKKTDWEKLETFMLNDKKKTGTKQNFTLLSRIGRGVWDVEL